eukprot:TRINITY_DN407_c0_g1_i1.p1 TRINITY_DN407_c0_g1~~TRINITY_DN407_c0_g1_i1.p1  ORF type:complete len:541 (+),score=105.48 TRINITY_DN407_c0_g1_i1:99-1721(+)
MLLHVVAVCFLVVHAHVDVAYNAQHPIFVTRDRFIAFTLDEYFIRGGYGPGYPRIVSLAKALSPGYIRVGGTSVDFICYEGFDQDSNPQPTACKAVDGQPSSRFVMEPAQFDGLMSFANDTGMPVLFGLAAVGGVRRADGAWDPTNAASLLRYAVRRGYVEEDGSGLLAGVMLGNEPDLWTRHNLTRSPQGLAEDFRTLYHTMVETDVTMGFGAGGPLASTPIYGCDLASRDEFWEGWVKAVAGDGSGSYLFPLAAWTWHFYYESGKVARPDDCINPKVLDRFADNVRAHVALLPRTSSAAADGTPQSSLRTPVYLSESASYYGGGAPGISASFASSFMLHDKLGLAGRLGISGVARQSWTSGAYKLVDARDPDHPVPMPGYFVALLMHRLVSTYVLNVTSPLPDTVRAYAWCAKADAVGVSPATSAGDVVVSVLNVGNHTETLSLSAARGATEREVSAYAFFLEPCVSPSGPCRSSDSSASFTSKWIGVIGGPPLVFGDEAPHVSLRGVEVAVDRVQVPGRTHGWVLLRGAMASACADV